MPEIRQVRDTLRPRFGSALADDPGLAEGALSVLRSFISFRNFHDLHRRMDDYLFSAVYDRLGPGMAVEIGPGQFRRLSLEEIDAAADDLMGLWFEGLKPDAEVCARLRAYWMDTGSPAAMRCLYRQYGAFLPEAEKDMIGKYLTENRLL